MRRCLVTGAAGFVGSHLVDRLLELGHEVAGVDCFTDYYARERKEANLAGARDSARFRLVEADLRDASASRLLDGVEYAFHLAAQAGVRGSWGATFDTYVEHNISATQRLLEAAKEASLRRFVFASSSSVYGDVERPPATEDSPTHPVSPYGVTKLAAEHLCTLYGRSYGVPVVSLRLFTVYGPRQRPDMAVQRFLTAAARGETVTVFGDGSQTRDFTYVADVVDAFVAAMDAPEDERVLNVCGGSRVSLNALLDMVREVTARPLEVEHAEPARGDAHHTLGDHARARRAIGFEPKVSLREGLAAQWRALGADA